MNWRLLDLTLTNIDFGRGGEIHVLVFQEDGFPKDHAKAVKRYILNSEETKHNISIEVPEGMFALKIHHDENSSGSVSKNWTGIIPSEGLAFSSGARVRFGAPSFRAAKMDYPEDGSLSLQILYP